jgi:hypothetical protein
MRYTYFYVEPSDKPPFKKRIRYTKGKFERITEPMGVFGFRYAMFRNTTNVVMAPIHDLTPETKQAIGV